MRDRKNPVRLVCGAALKETLQATANLGNSAENHLALASSNVEIDQAPMVVILRETKSRTTLSLEFSPNSIFVGKVKCRHVLKHPEIH